MARTTVKAIYNNIQESNKLIEQILLSHNYKLKEENGENVWKCGNGFWTAMKYVKIEVLENNEIEISGWIRPALGSEQDLSGFVGALPKNQVKKVIEEIKAAIV